MLGENPFFVGSSVPAEHFVGRRAEVQAALAQIKKRGHVAVFGSPGMGKASFLRYLREPTMWPAGDQGLAGAIVVWVPSSRVIPFTPDRFWREVLNALSQKCRDIQALQSEIQKISLSKNVRADSLRALLSELGNQNRFVLLLLEEYDTALFANPPVYTETDMISFLSEFRSLAVHTDEGRFLSTVVTSNRPLDELGPNLAASGSPWYNHYMFLALKPLDDVDVATLFNRLPATVAQVSNLLSTVREIADGHPSLVQHVCFRLFELVNANPLPPRNPSQWVDEFLQAVIESTRSLFRNAWKASSDVEKMLLMFVALSHLEGRLNRQRQYKLVDLDLIFSQRERELRDLVTRGLLRRNVDAPGPPGYTFTSSLMASWVIREIELEPDEAAVAERQKVFVGLSRKDVDQIQKVLLQVWQHKDAAVVMSSLAGKLVGAFTQGVAHPGSHP